MYPRLFARVRPTGRNSDVAKLIVGPKAPVIDCRVVDYSAGGACLEIRVAVLSGSPGDVWESLFNRLAFSRCIALDRRSATVVATPMPEAIAK